MTTAIIISAIIFVIGITIMVAGCFINMSDGVFFGGIVAAVAAAITMICLALINDGKNTQKQIKEYQASEYTFKIKVVEFEEQRDTILVVIPKEEKK